MKNRMIKVFVISFMLALAATGCGSSSDSASSDSSTVVKEYVEEDQIDEVFTNPDDFKGKYIKLTGQVLDNPEVDDDETAIQLYYDTVNYDKNYVVYASDLKEEINADDYLIIDGEILGEFTGENALGGEVTCPMIQASSVTKSNYMDIVVPTLKSLDVNDTEEQHDCSITLKKVEYAETETRVYFEEKNDSDDTVSFGNYSMRIIQDGKQIDQADDNGSEYNGNYETLASDLSAGATSSGIVIFPAIDQDTDFQLVVPDSYSDNYDVEFKDFEFEVSVE